MKKFLASAIIILLLVSPAFAYVNLALTAAELAAPFVIGAGVKYFMPTAKTTNLTNYGSADNYTVQKKGLAQYGKTAMGVTLAVGIVSLMDYIKLYPSTYPDLNSKARAQTNQPSTVVTGSAPSVAIPTTIGSVFTAGGNTVTLTGYTHYTTGGCSSVCYGSDQYPVVYASTIVWNRPYGGKDVWAFSQGGTLPAPSYVDYTPAQFSANIQTLGELYPTSSAEIGSAIIANPSLATFPDAVVKANANDAVTAVAAQTSTDAVTAAAADTTAAQNAYNATPNATTLQALRDAQAREALLKDQQARDDIQKNTEQQEKDDAPSAVAAAPVLKTIVWVPLSTIGSAFADKFPFSLLTTVSNLVGSFVASPVTPSFSITFPAPFNYTWSFNLSRWDTWATLFRSLLGLSFLGWCSMTILRRWQ